MSTLTGSPLGQSVGDLLREWRHRRRLSQLDLAVEAEVSARHLSFVETGRSKPSRELVLHLAEHLDVPLRERNHLLLAAGFAPVFRQTPLEAPVMSPVRAALDRILAAHQPYPAVIVDSRWDLVTANQSALALLTEGVAPHLLEGTVNSLRVSLHPDGLAPRIVNLGEYSEHLLSRLRRQAVLSGDARISALVDELRAYPGVRDLPAPAKDSASETASLLFVPLVLERPDGTVLRFFSTIATFGTALDITVSELAIESFFPADDETADRLRSFAN